MIVRVGDVVHFSRGDKCYAAMVTEARDAGGGDQECRLVIYPPGMAPLVLNSWYARTRMPGAAGWHPRALFSTRDELRRPDFGCCK